MPPLRHASLQPEDHARPAVGSRGIGQGLGLEQRSRAQGRAAPKGGAGSGVSCSHLPLWAATPPPKASPSVLSVKKGRSEDVRALSESSLNSKRQDSRDAGGRSEDGKRTRTCEPAGTNSKEVPMATSLTSDLRQGYRQVACELSEDNLALLSRARDSINGRPAEHNLVLAEIVCAYRAGPRQLWGPVLLDLLAPALLRRLQRLREVLPAIDNDEIRQQLVLELLHAAATM